MGNEASFSLIHAYLFRQSMRPLAEKMPMFSGKARHLFPEITYIEGKISDNWEEIPVAEGESGAESF